MKRQLCMCGEVELSPSRPDDTRTVGDDVHRLMGPCVVAVRPLPKLSLGNDPVKTWTIDDPVHHPSHYTDHPSGVECLTITEHMSFLRGNAIKYLWRAGKKKDAIVDLENRDRTGES